VKPKPSAQWSIDKYSLIFRSFVPLIIFFLLFENEVKKSVPVAGLEPAIEFPFAPFHS